MRAGSSQWSIVSKSVFCIALSAMLSALCVTAQAQQPGKIPRIGYISGSRGGTSVTAFRQGLRDLGYIEEKNISIAYRYVEGNMDRIPILVSDLIKLNVDVLVSPLPQAIIAAKQATKTIPIVMMTTQDPVATGLVDSLARPGGNVTGVTRQTRELSGKRLELLKETISPLSLVGVLWETAGAAALETGFRSYEQSARALKIQLQSFEVRGPNPDLEGVFRAATRSRVSAVITVLTGLLSGYRKQIADLTVMNRLPLMSEGSALVEAGGLMSYSATDADSYRRGAVYVDKILKGTKPADLPVEQPTKFELVINLKTAKQIGVTIPPNVLARADRVIK